MQEFAILQRMMKAISTERTIDKMKVEFPRSAPEAQGIPSEAIAAFVDAIERDGLELHGLMVLRHGHVVAEGWWRPYRAELCHMLFSLSKSFTSTAIGFAVTEGMLKLDDRLIDFFPERAGMEGYWQRLTLRHLITMSTGHKNDTMEAILAGGDWADGFFNIPLIHEPGSHFLYNTGATYMLSVVLQKVTGQRVLDYLTPRLLQPLGIEGALWEQSPQGYDAGGFGLAIQTSDIARFGQFLLQRGMWQGKQLIPSAWIDEATASHIDNGPNENPDWEQGYGYQFWRCQWPGGYRGDGAFGQYCLVFPQEDAVVAINSGLGDMQAVLTHLWKLVLPAMHGAKPANPTAHAALQARLAGLHYDPPASRRDGAREAALTGRTFTFAENPLGMQSIGLAFHGAGCTLTLANATGRHSLELGDGTWAIGPDTGVVSLPLGPDNTLAETAAAFTWAADGRLQLTIRRILSPYVLAVSLAFEGDGLTMEITANVNFGPTELPKLTATAR